MSELQYSKEALESLRLFHRVSVIVFVEGKVDKIFWNKLLQKYGKNDYYVDVAGGKLELMRRYEELKDSKERILFCCDSDYDGILGKKIQDDRIIYTYGYSIENTLYCPRNISNIISNCCFETADFSKDYEDWLNNFSKSCEKLVLYDIAKMKYEKDFVVMEDSPCRFMKGIAIKQSEVDSYISEIESEFEELQIEECRRLLSSYNRHIRHVIKGHFLTYAVIMYIKNVMWKKTRQKLTLPDDVFVSMTFEGCNVCKKKNCAEVKEIKEKIIQFFN